MLLNYMVIISWLKLPYLLWPGTIHSIIGSKIQMEDRSKQVTPNQFRQSKLQTCLPNEIYQFALIRSGWLLLIFQHIISSIKSPMNRNCCLVCSRYDENSWKSILARLPWLNLLFPHWRVLSNRWLNYSIT